MKMLRVLGLGLGIMLAWAGMVQAQTWTSITNQPTFFPDTAVLLTDGRVMTHEYNTSNWWSLTPDNKGSYLNGTWTKLGSMQSTYAPLYFASVVLRDGRVLVEGGEYNFLNPVETNLGSIYDPAANTWTAVNPPSGWSTIGDSPAVALANSTVMIGRNASTQTAFFNATNLTWTISGTGKADIFSEEGLVLLPDTSVLTVDTQKAKNAERYLPPASQNKWINAGTTPSNLADPGSLEIGPMILRPDGTVFAMVETPRVLPRSTLRLRHTWVPVVGSRVRTSRTATTWPMLRPPSCPTEMCWWKPALASSEARSVSSSTTEPNSTRSRSRRR